jgi:hypothetical protein
LSSTNGGLIDYTGKNNFETIANTKLSTAITKFGNASMYFDGTDDVLRAIASPNLDFRTGSFTVEFWMYAISTANSPAVVTVGSDAEGLVVRFVGGNWYNYWVGAGDIFGTSGVAVTTGQWVHVAWTRNGTSMKFFVNGTQIGNTVTSTANHVSTGGASVGGPSTSGTAFAVFNGYVDDVRITKGYARYTANFTPPTSAFRTF